MVSIYVLLVILFLVCLLLFSFRGNRVLPLAPKSKVLLVSAHPDDETMFFSPVLRGLRLGGHRVFVICISTGNFYGLGRVRGGEMFRAVSKLGLASSDVTILDYEEFQDGSAWDRHQLAAVLLKHIEVLSVDCVISFDSHGVSGHNNHISCFEALQDLYTRSLMPKDVQVFVLDSISLARKYIGLFDAPISVLRSPYRYFAWGRDVAAAWRAMLQHRSQLVWFRFLFMIFSRYIYINTLRRIAPVVRVPRQKSKTS
jgi:N-acetylglucosaminylphosphatidylinositol deacetylase